MEPDTRSDENTVARSAALPWQSCHDSRKHEPGARAVWRSQGGRPRALEAVSEAVGKGRGQHLVGDGTLHEDRPALWRGRGIGVGTHVQAFHNV